MDLITESWKKEILKHKNLIILSIFFLIIAIIINFVSGSYINRTSAVAVPDMILDNIPTLDLDFFFVYGIAIILIIFFLYPIFFEVNMIHITISQFSLLVLIRSFFTALTHLSVPTDALSFNSPNLFAIFDFKNALFFSGHTAFPFLGFLLFKKERIGKFFLISTLIMALTVLFMHVHYSIDVFAALFITYGSFKIGKRFFIKL